MWNLFRYFSRPKSAPRPDVSILMATLNASGRVTASIQSVLAQTGVPTEIIIYDGGSTDGTVEEITAASDQIVLRTEPDSGVYDALNKARKLARGRFLLILGAGDRLRPGALSALLAQAPAGNRGLIYGDVYMEDLACRYGGPWDAERFRKDNLCQQGILYGRGVFDLVGEFDLQYPILADYAFNIKCFGHKRITCRHVDLVVADYLGDGLSARTRDEAFQRDRPQLLERHLGLPPKASKRVSA
jgi:glycosyltransferase involved in cell wall biosynthesis